jgi:hypothetical protein
MNKRLLVITLGIIAGIYSSIFVTSYAQSTECYDGRMILHVIQLQDILNCLDDKTFTFTDKTTASNVGIGVQVFKQETGDNLEFRTLTSGTYMALSQGANAISINNAELQALQSNVDVDIQKVNIGTAYTDIYTDTFDFENINRLDCSLLRKFRVTYQIDYGSTDTGSQSYRWVSMTNSSNVLFEVTGITADTAFGNSGFFDKPIWCVQISQGIEMEGKSTVATDSPTIKGYTISAK